MAWQTPVPVTDPDPGCAAVTTMPSPGVRSRHIRLAALPSAVPCARRILRDMLSEWHFEDMSDPALLLLSELVTNAVAASGSGPGSHQDHQRTIALTLRLTDTSLQMEVWDASPALPRLQETGLTRDHGWGLQLVDALAEAWGHRPAGDGKVVWCNLPLRWSASARRHSDVRSAQIPA